MASNAAFGETENVAITVLVDNSANLMARSRRGVRRFTRAPLLAEHGFAALVDLRSQGVRVLWDAGMTPGALIENMRRMRIPPGSIDILAVSHGHDDHTAAVTEVLKAMDLRAAARTWPAGSSMQEMRRWVEGRRVPLVIHPAAFRERWEVHENGSREGPVQPFSRAEWEAAGAQVVESEGPHRLAAGCWTTGFVPRLSFEQAGRSPRSTYRQGDAFLPDDLEEDQAIVIHVKGKGLVVLAGCAHAGIVNTVNYARQISAVERVWAVLGGFHLATAGREEIERSVEAIRAMQPKLVAPSHCTGFEAQCCFATRMPQAFVEGVVGTTYRF